MLAARARVVTAFVLVALAVLGRADVPPPLALTTYDGLGGAQNAMAALAVRDGILSVGFRGGSWAVFVRGGEVVASTVNIASDTASLTPSMLLLDNDTVVVAFSRGNVRGCALVALHVSDTAITRTHFYALPNNRPCRSLSQSDVVFSRGVVLARAPSTPMNSFWLVFVNALDAAGLNVWAFRWNATADESDGFVKLSGVTALHLAKFDHIVAVSLAGDGNELSVVGFGIQLSLSTVLLARLDVSSLAGGARALSMLSLTGVSSCRALFVHAAVLAVDQARNRSLVLVATNCNFEPTVIGCVVTLTNSSIAGADVLCSTPSAFASVLVSGLNVLAVAGSETDAVVVGTPLDTGTPCMWHVQMGNWIAANGTLPTSNPNVTTRAPSNVAERDPVTELETFYVTVVPTVSATPPFRYLALAAVLLPVNDTGEGAPGLSFFEFDAAQPKLAWPTAPEPASLVPARVPYRREPVVSLALNLVGGEAAAASALAATRFVWTLSSEPNANASVEADTGAVVWPSPVPGEYAFTLSTGFSSTSIRWTLRVGDVPAQVSSPTVIADSASEATIRWVAPTLSVPQAYVPLAFYNVLRTDTNVSAEPAVLVARVPANSSALEARVRGLTASALYRFAVEAVNEFGASPPPPPSTQIRMPFVCQPGYILPLGAAACVPCAAGSFQPNFTEAARPGECVPCAEGSFSDAASSAEANCTCVNGWFERGRTAFGAPVCERCVTGAVCPGGLAQPLAAAEHYESAPGVFALCPRREACLRGSVCARGYMARACDVCALGFFDASTRQCRACPASAGTTAALVTLAVVLAVCATGAVALSIHGADGNVMFGVTAAGALFSAWQQIALLGTLDVRWPRALRELALVGAALGGDVRGGWAGGCLDSSTGGVLAWLTLQALALPLWVALFAAVFAGARRLVPRLAVLSVREAVCLLPLEVATVPLTWRVFTLVDCRRGVDAQVGAWVLGAVPSVPCYTGGWWGAFFIWLIALTALVVALPARLLALQLRGAELRGRLRPMLAPGMSAFDLALVVRHMFVVLLTLFGSAAPEWVCLVTFALVLATLLVQVRGRVFVKRRDLWTAIACEAAVLTFSLVALGMLARERSAPAVEALLSTIGWTSVALAAAVCALTVWQSRAGSPARSRTEFFVTMCARNLVDMTDPAVIAALSKLIAGRQQADAALPDELAMDVLGAKQPARQPARAARTRAASVMLERSAVEGVDDAALAL